MMATSPDPEPGLTDETNPLIKPERNAGLIMAVSHISLDPEYCANHLPDQ